MQKFKGGLVLEEELDNNKLLELISKRSEEFYRFFEQSNAEDSYINIDISALVLTSVALITNSDLTQQQKIRLLNEVKSFSNSVIDNALIITKKY